jgi:uncharacterized membrane protein YqjE
MNAETRMLQEASFPELLKRLQTDLVALADTEKKLVQAELSLKWEEAKTQLASLMVALAFSLLAGMCLAASAILGLSMILVPWLAALIVGGGLLALCAAAFAKMKASAESFTPKLEHTIESVKRDVKTMGEVAR